MLTSTRCRQSHRRFPARIKGWQKMKVYELMSILANAEAGKEVTAVVCLSPTELIQHGDRIDNDCFCLILEIEDADPDSGQINLIFRRL